MTKLYLCENIFVKQIRWKEKSSLIIFYVGQEHHSSACTCCFDDVIKCTHCFAKNIKQFFFQTGQLNARSNMSLCVLYILAQCTVYWRCFFVRHTIKSAKILQNRQISIPFLGLKQFLTLKNDFFCLSVSTLNEWIKSFELYTYQNNVIHMTMLFVYQYITNLSFKFCSFYFLKFLSLTCIKIKW